MVVVPVVGATLNVSNFGDNVFDCKLVSIGVAVAPLTSTYVKTNITLT